jgi:hypothetical protein
VDVVVILELSQGEEISPVILPLVHEDPQVLFQLLVNSFSLPVTLWVIGSSGRQFDTKQPVKFPGELGHKLRLTIGHDFTR